MLRSPNPRESDDVARSWTRVSETPMLVLPSINEAKVMQRSISNFAPGEEKFDVFNVKGPMGKGLCIQPSGVHVAFCAGTGVLVFLDLIAHLLLRSYYKHYVDPNKVPKQMHQLKDDFVFLFYVSMMSMDSEIGLNICEAL